MNEEVRSQKSAVPAPRRRRKKRADAGPPLPLKTPPAPVVFRRKDRSARLYCRFRDPAGKVIVRSTRTHTLSGAETFLAMVVRRAAGGLAV